ncbi:ABC transporter ATP-binding protein [Xylanibacter muris]|uniref:ABC transporter ATP-binding protein n=1 Tax=Xylanibacter muris TaxID=2736290 RepID=A0ABX2ANT9_9BACT|nr:ABC transporter ATP-binding protein [Xylanibacter muris]NPD92415.1 ABC transporter ATP-binding protein [Xylanibacter muris]
MLEVKSISMDMGGRQLFDGLSFVVEDGKVFCIMGGSGCGKTSLLRALMGFETIGSGYISIDGELLTPSSAEQFRRYMSYIPQEPALPSEWVRDLVSLPFELAANRGKPFSKSLLFGEWERLGLERELYGRKVAELSGGQRQRVMLSVSGLLNKPLLLVDEPTSALDRHSSGLVLGYLRHLASRGSTVVAVSHDEEFAAGCDGRIVIS